MTNSTITADALRRVPHETFVRQVEFLSSTPSTNDAALQFAADAETHCPCLVISPNQTAGRGRGANRWWSAEGSLTFSLIIEPERHVAPDRLHQISLTTGLAVCEVLRSLLPEANVGLKWPNDVHLDGHKTCGILAEIPPSRSDRLVIGIGINVNNSFADAPDELRAIATSLVDVGKQSFDPLDVLVRVLGQLEIELNLLGERNSQLPGRWQSFCVLRGRTIRHHAGENVTVGTCLGIDDEGAIVVQAESGRHRFFGGVLSRAELGEAT